MAGIAAPFDLQPRLKLQPRPGTGPGIGPVTTPPTVIPTGASGGGAPPSGMTLGGTFPPTTPPTTTITTPVVTTTVTATGGQPVEVGGEGPIYINVVNTIQNAVNTSVQAGTDATNGVISGITGPLNQTISDLNTGVGNAFAAIVQTLNDFNSGIGGLLGNINSLISNGILGTIATVTAQLAGILGQISSQIGGLAGAIGQAVAQVIPVIVAAITNPIGAITGVLGRIEQDIASNIATLTQVGSDISGGFTGLDSTLGRLLTNWETYNTGFTEAQTGYPDGGNLHHDLSDIVKAIAGLLTTLTGIATVRLSDSIEAPCNGTLIQAALQQPYVPLTESNSPFEYFGAIAANVIRWLLKLIPAIGKVTTAAEQQFNQECSQALLTYEQLVDAVQRGFLPLSQAQTEAARGDLDANRFEVLRSLAIEQLSASQLVTALYRGVIQQADFTTAMGALGFTASQQNIVQALGVSLLSVADLQEAFRYSLIDQPTLEAGIKAQQFDDAQNKLLQALTLRPPRMQEAIDGGAAAATLGQLGALAESDVNRIPEYISVAALSEGLSTDAMNQRWLAHWNTGSVASWITLYFRGLVSLQTVQAAMSRNFIPQSLQTTLIESSRPLIQFRTISNMLRIGQIDVQQAGQLLLQHGYTPENAQLLITYSQRPGAAVKAQQAKATHTVSLGIAKNEYVDGSISETDYYEILIAHGYTIDGANAEITVVNAQQAMLHRKQNAQLVVDEYGAGLIDEQTALAQLAALGLTINELAKYAHKIRAFRIKGAKIPSEADLNHFLQLGIIDANTYKSQLIAQHYSATAANWFLEWRQHPAASIPGPTTTTPPTSG